MKVFAIKDDELDSGRVLGHLVYYEKSGRFYIELTSDADVWETPPLLSSFVRKGQHSINSYWSRLWVQQRIVPTDRQNLGAILRDSGMSEYDEFKLLIKNRGRCEQDSYYLEAVSADDFFNIYRSRFEYKLDAVVPLDNFRLLCFFRNGYVCKCNIKILCGDKKQFFPVITHESLFKRVELQADGYGVTFGPDLDISDYDIFLNGNGVDISFNDFKAFVRYNVISTSEAQDIMNCSRQNIDNLVKSNTLTPIKVTAKSKLFLKNEISDRMN